MAPSLFDFTVKNTQGAQIPLSEYKHVVTLAVNVASQCGFTPQYQGLEKLQEKYAAQGFSVLAFPCNQFGAQEPGTDQEIEQFCQLNYQTTFPIFSKIEVNGPGASPVYEFLKSSAPGILGIEAIKWNFTKFLINKDGQVIKRYAPVTAPEEISKDIEEALKAQPKT